MRSHYPPTVPQVVLLKGVLVLDRPVGGRAPLTSSSFPSCYGFCSSIMSQPPVLPHWDPVVLPSCPVVGPGTAVAVSWAVSCVHPWGWSFSELHAWPVSSQAPAS